MTDERPRALVVTWAGGGNVPPLLAAAELLATRRFDVDVMTSSATRSDAARYGFRTHGYRRAPEPDVSVAFEAQARRFLVQAARVEIARDVHERMQDLQPHLLLVDCMLPAALAAGEAAGVPTASLVHFPYALARSVMARGGGAWTTDRTTLDATRRTLGLPPTTSDLDAWESPELLLVTLPRWFDVPGELPQHVVHAGPLGIRASPPRGGPAARPRALLAFSTTVMDGQRRLVANVCAALERAGIGGILTLGPALDRTVVDAATRLEVLEWADHHHAAARVRVAGTVTGPYDPPGFAPTHRRLTTEFGGFYEFEGERVRRARIIVNMNDVAIQIGAAPRPGTPAERLAVAMQRLNAGRIARRSKA